MVAVLRAASCMLLSVIVLQSCSRSPVAPALGTADLVGVVTAREVTERGLRVLVEEDPRVQQPLEPGGTKIWFTITGDTRLYRKASSGTLIRTAEESIEVGRSVEAWVGGNAIADSYPQQALAATIVVER